MQNMVHFSEGEPLMCCSDSISYSSIIILLKYKTNLKDYLCQNSLIFSRMLNSQNIFSLISITKFKQQMELDFIRKKVYMTTQASSFIDHRPHLLPQFITDTQINFVSAYEFGSYSLEDQYVQIISREQSYGQVLSYQCNAEMNEHNCEVSYVCRQDQKYYLMHISGLKVSKILLYRNNGQKKTQLVFDFYDFFIAEKEQLKSSRSILARTHKLIDELDEEEKKDGIMVQDITNVYQLAVLLGKSYAIILVDMKTRTGLMLVNIVKANKQKQKQFSCPIRAIPLRKHTPDLSLQESQASRIIYMFPERALQFYKTRDITRFVLRTQNFVILTKIVYEQMEFSIVHGLEFKKEKIVSVGVSFSGDQEIVLVVVENRQGRKYMKMYMIEARKLVEIKDKKQNGGQFDIDADIHLNVPHRTNVKFSQNVICSHYQIQPLYEQVPATNLPKFSEGLILQVYEKMMEEDRQTQKQIISRKQLLLKENNVYLHTNKQFNKFDELSQNQLDCIKGFVCNKDTMVFWEDGEAVVHVCRIVGKREQEEQYRERKENDRSKSTKRIKKQEEIKQVYGQLIGVEYEQERMLEPTFQPKFSYFAKIQLDLTHRKIINLVLSPSNSNFLILSSNESNDSLEINVFQLDLFKQLGNQDPSIFLKPLKNVYKPKPVESIANGLIKQYNLFLSGTLIHSRENQLLDGVLAFDMHPYNYFVAVSFGFAVKIYGFQGTQRLTSLFTLNGQGFKQVKYSPLGNHLCILTSKTIKILDSYSFSIRYTISQKISNFIRCLYSSNGLEFYTLTQHHTFNIWNTFDYAKLDTIKPIKVMNEFKPISVKSYLKINQYCLVLQSGMLYVRYKNAAVVVASERLYGYDDGEQINCIEIDEKNGVLFTGCRSGRIRSHIWPMKDQDTFESYSELRIGFAPITCLSLSNISPTLHAGAANGNIARLKYTINRDRGIGTTKEHNLLFTDRNFRYLGSISNIEKIYKFVLTNALNLSSDQIPDKVCLEFKLSQVINKLKEEMKKLKTNIREQLQEKSKLTMEKVDFGLLHHVNHMIANKLYTQLRDEIQGNRTQVQQLKLKFKNELDDVIRIQNDLIKEKSFKTCDYSQERQELKKALLNDQQISRKQMEAQLKKFREKNEYAKTLKNSQEEQLYFMPNQEIEEYEQLKVKLEEELSRQTKKHYELKKQCAYKETAIKGMNLKKIKEETLQFKFNLQKAQMVKKLAYNKDIVQQLQQKIDISEHKMHQIQTQAHIIKNNAQYKRTARVDEMIDACSYKLSMKEKLEEENIAQYAQYLKSMEELMESKGGQMVDILEENREYVVKLAEFKEYVRLKRDEFNAAKMKLLNSRRALQQFNCNQYLQQFKKSNKKKTKRGHLKGRMSCKLKTASTDRQVPRSTSISRLIQKNDKQIPMFYKLMDKEEDCLRMNIKNHQRKVTKLGKQNGRILLEYERLKLQQKTLVQKQASAANSLDKIQNDQLLSKLNSQRSPRPTLQLAKTSYQKYIELKSSKSRIGLKYMTATSTPRHLVTPWQTDSFDCTQN